MDEYMIEKEMASIQAQADAKRQEEAIMREKEMASIQAQADAKRQEEARIIAKSNGTFDYSEDETEEIVPKRR